MIVHQWTPSSGWKSRDDVPKLVDEYMAGVLKVDEFVTFTLPLEQIIQAFDYMHEGKRWVYMIWFCIFVLFFF